MSDSNNTFRNTVESLFKGMDSFITTKTVVGDAIHIEYHHSSISGCILWCRRRCIFTGEEEQRSRRNGWKDYTECGSCHSEWHHQACKY